MSRRFTERLDWLIPRRDALAFAVQLVVGDDARLGQGDAAPILKRYASARP